MLKPNNIKSKTFSSVKNGYDPVEVQEFLAQVAKEYAQILVSVEDDENKIIKLVDKINEYREDEDAIKNALIMSQKEASKTVSEAKAKARDMIESAKSEQVRLAEQSSAECEKIIHEHKQNCATLIKENTEITENKIKEIRKSYDAEKLNYDTLKKEVTYFKATLLELYNKQLHLLMEMPEIEPEQPVVEKSEEETEVVIENAVAVDATVSEPKIAEVKTTDVEEKVAVEAAYFTKSHANKAKPHVEKILSTGSFEPVIPKENLTDLKFGKNK